MWAQLSMLRRGLLSAARDEHGSIHLQATERLNQPLNITEQLLVNLRRPRPFVGHQQAEALRACGARLIRDACPRLLGTIGHGPSRLVYDFPSTSAAQLVTLLEREDNRWDLDGSWDIGGYTLMEYRRFWTALTACVLTHEGIAEDVYRANRNVQVNKRDLITVRSRPV